MKKNLFFMMAAGAMLFATSCQNDLDIMGNVGKETLVSFNVTTPEIVTRAYSDGLSAKDLQYAVYDANGNYLSSLTGTGEFNALKANVELQLTTGNTYTVIFWADNADAPYTVDFANKTMTVDYTGVACNNEKLDAFYYAHKFTVTGAQTENVELRRPFAQLNIGTADYAASTAAGYTPTHSAVTVKNVYSTFDLAEGEVDYETATAVTFASAEIDRNQQFPVEGNYEYIAMNYLLVEKETVEVVFTYTDGTNDKTRTVGSVPVQRNYRTNIYGNLLTSMVDVNVEIKPAYDGDLESDAIMVNNANELQAALNAAPVGETTTISLAKEIEGDVIEFQKADRHIVILGCGNKYDGTIKIHTGSNYNNGSITIKDVKFETSTASLNFIMPNDFGVENGVTRRYSQNVVVDGCTFTATGDAVNTAVGVQAKSCNNVQVLNCRATDMHSLIQAQSCGTDVIVKDCTINGKNGVAFKQVKAATVEKTTITAAEYGIRFDGNTANYGIIARDINVTAKQPFIVRKMTGANNTIAFEGNNTLVSGETYQIVITKGSDDEAYSFPAGTYTLTGADDFNVYPIDVEVTGVEDFSALLNDPNASVVTAEAGTTIDNGTNGFSIGHDVVLDMNGANIVAGGKATKNASFSVSGEYDVTINDANIAGGSIMAYYGAKVVLDGVNLTYNFEQSGRNLVYVGSDNDKVAELTIKSGNFTLTGGSGNRYLCAHGNAIIRVEGGNFSGKVQGSSNAAFDAITIGSYVPQIIITGGTFDHDPSAYVAAGYVATKSGSTWTVTAQ